MKKKFVLTLALVLMVATTLFAATPVEMSGEFNATRTFKFDPNSIGASTKFKLDKLSVSGDFWKISIGAGVLNFGNDTNNGVADIYLDKALAAQGVDMGDVTLTLSVGDMSNSGILSVYDDPNDSIGKGLEMNGVLAVGTTAVTVGYADMVTVKGALNFDTANKPFVISAKGAPVDGVEATVGFTNYAVGDTKGGIGGSVKVDVAALAGLDFDLYASAYDKFLLDSKDNFLYITLGGGIEDIALDAEFVMAAKNDLIFNASYKGIENLGLSAGLQLKDLSDVKTIVTAAVDYTMGGVKYKVAVKHDSTVLAGAAKLSVTPSVTIKF